MQSLKTVLGKKEQQTILVTPEESANLLYLWAALGETSSDLMANKLSGS